jgi:hypothetical protein
MTAQFSSDTTKVAQGVPILFQFIGKNPIKNEDLIAKSSIKLVREFIRKRWVIREIQGKAPTS